MKPSAILLRAAELVDSEVFATAWPALGDACEDYPSQWVQTVGYWNRCIPVETSDPVGFGDRDDSRKHRVLALCLAAAVAESEGE